MAAVVFMQGCPWRCPFCHNTHLQDINAETNISWTKFIDEIKPYLRPMSSMTEEEKETYQMFFNEYGLLNTSIDIYLDWLLEGHFDFRGLIQRCLALEAPEDMYK
jgi:hypothetical protein